MEDGRWKMEENKNQLLKIIKTDITYNIQLKLYHNGINS